MGDKLWGGRFVGRTDPLMERFSSSFSFDRRLWAADIAATAAHVRVLARGGYLNQVEAQKILKALEEIKGEIASGRLPLEGEWEDIHSFLLARLEKKVGRPARKVHAGRSRNDLIALDLRLYLREKTEEITGLLADLQSALVLKGEETADVIIPAYTHLQRAQPVSFAHHLLAYVEMLERDKERLGDARKRLEVLPSGAAAVAGTSLDLDLKLMARLLGFRRLAANSMDAVSDRDFVLEIMSALALAGLHFSRLAEELVLWSSAEFSFIRLGEAFCTGSSYLPQKRNPDAAELVRGKTGRLLGNFTALFTVIKGLPLAYNRDLQEDKQPLFDTVDTVSDCAAILIRLVESMELNRPRLKRLEEEDYGAAPELAEFLVKKGRPFQEAHRIVGRMVLKALESGRRLRGMSVEEMQEFCPDFDAAAFKLISAGHRLDTRVTLPASHPRRIKANLRRWKKTLGAGRRGKKK